VVAPDNQGSRPTPSRASRAPTRQASRRSGGGARHSVPARLGILAGHESQACHRRAALV